MAWCLVANTGMLHILQQDLMLIGRDQCDISIQSRSVDKQHSVIAFDQIEGTHSIKDVGSLNGTFVNESRIPEETYIQLKKGDSIRFGYDPITYRFDSLQLDNISVVKDQEGFIKQETPQENYPPELIWIGYDNEEEMNDLRDFYYEVEEEEEEYEDAYLTRQTPPDYNQSLRRAMQKRNAKESRNTYGKQASLQDHRPAAHGSPLYGQPAWWGESEDPSPDGSTSPDDLRPRTNTYSTQGSSDDNRPLESPSPHEPPSRLPSHEPERDIPVVIYNRSDRRPVNQQQQQPPSRPQPQAEITLMASSEKAIGFTIDFGSTDAAPKMARRPDSLQNCIPQNVRQKIEKSTRMMEELKAERLMKKSQEEEAVMQSPRASPLSSRTDAWSGVGPGGRRTPKGTPESPSPGYQADINFQQMQRKNKQSSNCLSEPLPPANLRQRTFVKSSQKTKPNRGSPSPTTPVSPSVDTEDDSQYQDDIEVEEIEVGGGDGGDDVSEAGTYTIESDTQSKEVQDARERIEEEFGVGEEEEEKVPSDDDTDKDVGDEEMEEEEVFSGKQNGGGSRLEKGGPGLRVRGDGSSRTAVNKIEDIEGKHKGGPGTPQWVHQWATMTTKSAPLHNVSPERTQHLSPDRHDVSPDHDVDGYEAEPSPRISDRDDHLSKKPPSGTRVQSSTPRTAPLQSPDSTDPRGSRGKRILPNTPADKLQTARQSSTSSSSEKTMRQNGFQASNSSAFHSPRNPAIEQQQQQQQPEQQQDRRYLQERAMEEKAFGKRRQLHGSSDPIVPMGYRQEEARRDSWGPEGSMDTDVLLKDTETLMRNLEERMRTKRQDTPSPEMSDSHDMPLDISQDISVVSFEADVDTDVDTVSNVSLVGGNNTWAGSKTRHYSCPEDNNTPEQPQYTNGRQKAPRSTEKARPTHADAQSRTSSNKTTPAPAKVGGIWSRLSTPNKHKMPSAEKEADSVSDSEHSFRRNTHLTGSLPTGRISNRSVSKGTSDNTKAVKKPRSLKPPNLAQPRQTRSTMLRKSRFSEDSGADHSDISPSSSMSDLSSSKNFRRGGSMRETRSGAVSDSGRRTPGERGRGRTSASNARNGDSSGRTDHSLGSQIARHARTQSMQDQKIKAAEPRSRLPSSASHNRTPSGNLSRKSSIGSTDSNVSGVRKTTSGAWRRYDTADDSDHDVDSYIKNVATRRTTTQQNHQSEERHAAPVIQRQKSSSLQNLQTSAPRTSPTRKAPNLRVEIAQASNTLAQSLQRLAQGESIDEIQVDRIPKEQQMMDNLLSEDSVHLSRQDIWQGERHHPQVPLQRSSSLSFQPDQTSQGLLPDSPPVHIKKKQFNKSEKQDQDFVSFDSLVLSSIHHLSIKMKDSADKIAYKLKKLQQPGASEDELSKVLRDSEFPLLKTNNKEIAGVLQNLRKMEKRLEEIHGMVDPRNEIKLPEQLSPVNQMRRQYATEFNFSTASDSETPLAMTTRHVGRAPVNPNLQRQRQQQQQQQQMQQQYQEQEEEYYL